MAHAAGRLPVGRALKSSLTRKVPIVPASLRVSGAEIGDEAQLIVAATTGAARANRRTRHQRRVKRRPCMHEGCEPTIPSIAVEGSTDGSERSRQRGAHGCAGG